MKRVQEMLGLSRTTINGLIAASFVTPVRGPRQEIRFSFQDLMLLRTAFALQQASIPPRKILRALARLKADLPAELPLTGLRITAVGPDVVVRDRAGQWTADTGQLLMDFEVAQVAGSVSILQAPLGSGQAKRDWFAEGEALEATDRAAAEVAYRRSIASDPGRASAHLNLGAMLCEDGRCSEALDIFDNALSTLPDHQLLHFNRAIALEDLGRPGEALEAYERAIALDRSLADAHYNTGVLLEKLGDAQGALRHFNAYRRLQRTQGS